MLSTVIVLSYLSPLGLYPSRRLAIGLAAPLAVVVAVAVASSAVLMSLALAVVAAVALSGAGMAPTSPGYLDRAPVQSQTTPAPTTAAPTPAVRILPPVWVDPVDDAIAEDLLSKYDRAIRSRHKARAASYLARYRAHLATQTRA